VTNTAISASNLTKIYNGTPAVDGVSVDVKLGSITGLVGRNGAGKTTLMRMLTRLVRPDGGEFRVLNGWSATDFVGGIVEIPALYLDMNAMGNMTMQTLQLGVAVDKEHFEATLRLVGLNPNNLLKVKNYSLGMKQRLAIAVTLVGKPKLLLLDEPTNGLDPEGIFAMRELFVKLNQELGITLLISSHILSELSKFATDYIFMDRGKVIKQIEAAELVAECQKVTRIRVDDVIKAVTILSANGYHGKSDGGNVIQLSGDVNTSELVLLLSNGGVNVAGLQTSGDDLESYFINLVGGNK
jgi:ABC-2 type transport system ATP-binding protein